MHFNPSFININFGITFRMQNLFSYTPEDLLDHSLFACHHGGDSYKLMTTFKTGK